MLLAVVGGLLDQGIVEYQWIVLGIVLGGVIGGVRRAWCK
jgi:NAD(P) transhydrogenase subunit beta